MKNCVIDNKGKITEKLEPGGARRIWGTI